MRSTRWPDLHTKRQRGAIRFNNGVGGGGDPQAYFPENLWRRDSDRREAHNTYIYSPI